MDNMPAHKNLAQVVREIQARPGMYFSEQKVEHIYSFLLGWDEARGTTWCRQYVTRLARIKDTGARVPGAEDIPFDEALVELERLFSRQ